MAMQGDVEHTGVLVEGLLGAVAMVNILGSGMDNRLVKAWRHAMGAGTAHGGFKCPSSEGQDSRLGVRRLGFPELHC